MAFRFALAPVLRLRQSMQRQRTLQLQEVNFQVARAEEAVAELKRLLAQAARSDAAGLAAGRTAAELQFAGILREKVEQQRGMLEQETGKLEILRQKALGEYHQAQRNREALEGLRARQRRDYQREQSRRQQQELDAVYLLQRWHRR